MIFPKIKAGFWSLLLFGGLFQSAYGQSNRYWTTNLQAEASLLSGMVIGGNAGMTAIYYNPAQIANITDSRFSVNANVLKLEAIRAAEIIYDQFDVRRVRLQVQPRFISYLFRPPGEKKFNIEVSAFSRDGTNRDVWDGGLVNVNLPGNPSGTVKFVSSYANFTEYRDNWYGIGIGGPISERWSLGASLFGSDKRLKYNYNVSYRAILDSTGGGSQDKISSILNREVVDISDVRVLGKLGIYYHVESFSMGLTVTLPTLSVYNLAKVEREYIQQNIPDTSGTGFIDDILIYDLNQKLKGGFKDPLSVALGATFTSADAKTSVFFSMEFFAPIAPYRLVEGISAPQVTPPDIVDEETSKDWLSYSYGAKAIFNAGFGVEHQLNEKLSLFGGFRTDWSFLRNFDYGELANLNRLHTVDYNEFHITAGARFNILSHNIIAGSQLSLGADKNNFQFVNLPNLGDPIPEIPPPGSGENPPVLKYRTLVVSVFLGFNLNFLGEKNQGVPSGD